VSDCRVSVSCTFHTVGFIYIRLDCVQMTKSPEEKNEPTHGWIPSPRRREGRLHVELNIELETWIRRTFYPRRADRSSRDGDERVVHRMQRLILFQTDLLDQILDHPDGSSFLNVLECFGETHLHDELSELVSRGVGNYLARIADENLRDMQELLRRSHIPIAWLLTLLRYIDYLETKNITETMIQSLVSILTVYSTCIRMDIGRGDLSRETYRNFCCYIETVLFIVNRITLRGIEVNTLFEEQLTPLLRLCTRLVEGNLTARQREQEHMVLQATITLASLATLFDDTSLVTSCMIFFRWEKILRLDTNETLNHSLSYLTKLMIRNSTHVRIGGSFYSYLSLCSYPLSRDIRMIGAIAIMIVLEMLENIDFLALNMDSDVQIDKLHVANRSIVLDETKCVTPSFYAYHKQAAYFQMQSDATKYGCHFEQVRVLDDPFTRKPNSFLAESILRLTGDSCSDIRKLGYACLDRLPLSIIQQVVWRPTLNPLFGMESQQIVVSMLIVCRRGELPLSLDVLINHVFPFACVASVSKFAYRKRTWND
jgi:hypothetical protein